MTGWFEGNGSRKKGKCHKYNGKGKDHMRKCVYMNIQDSIHNEKECINNSA